MKEITFNLDVYELNSLEEIKLNIEKNDGKLIEVKDIGNTYELSISVPNEDSGNKVINSIYGEEDDSRESNAFYLGLE